MAATIKETIHANGIDITVYTNDFKSEYISLTDIARITAISTFTGIPAKTIERYLSELKRYGLVIYKGSSNSGGYYIVNQYDILNKR